MDFGAPLLLPDGDEGRAMMQIVHDVAPGAKLAFHTAVEYRGRLCQRHPGAGQRRRKVIADDVTYFDEPFFQDGLRRHRPSNAANAAGVAYFSSAGNSGS